MPQPGPVDDSPAGGSLHRFAHGAFLFLLAFGLYANTLGHQFALDDSMLITGNSFVQKGYGGLGEIWTTDAFMGAHGEAFTLTGGRYRPLSVTTFALEYQWFGPTPGKDEGETFRKKLSRLARVEHTGNVLLYGLTGVFLYLLLLRVCSGQNEWIPLVAAAIFVVHPLHTEVVANIKSRDEILALLFLLLAAYPLTSRKPSWNGPGIVLAGLFYFLALLSKENTITALAFVPLLVFYSQGGTRRDGLRRAAIRTAPLILVAVVYLVLRGAFTHGFGERVATNVMDQPYLWATAAEESATIVMVWGKYLWMLFFPHPLSFDYSYRAIPYVNWSDWRPVVSLAVHVALATYVLVDWARSIARKTKPSLVSVGIFVYLCAFSIVSNLFFNIGTTLGERFAYLPSVGFCIAVAALLARLLRADLSQRLVYRPLWIIPIAVLLIAGGWETVDRNPAWYDDYTLYETDVRTVPTSAKAQLFVGISRLKDYYEHRDDPALLQRAIEAMEEACRINPTFHQAFYNLGLAYQAIPDHESAIRAFRRVLELEPRHINSHYYLGLSYARGRNDLEKAIEYMETALAHGYSGKDGYVNLGTCYARSGKIEAALAAFLKALPRNPRNAQLYLNIGTAYGRLGNRGKAEEFYEKAFELDPVLRQQRRGS